MSFSTVSPCRRIHADFNHCSFAVGKTTSKVLVTLPSMAAKTIAVHKPQEPAFRYPAGGSFGLCWFVVEPFSFVSYGCA